MSVHSYKIEIQVDRSVEGLDELLATTGLAENGVTAYVNSRFGPMIEFPAIEAESLGCRIDEIAPYIDALSTRVSLVGKYFRVGVFHSTVTCTINASCDAIGKIHAHGMNLLVTAYPCSAESAESAE